jgi:hypothetical protein
VSAPAFILVHRVTSTTTKLQPRLLNAAHITSIAPSGIGSAISGTGSSISVDGSSVWQVSESFDDLCALLLEHDPDERRAQVTDWAREELAQLDRDHQHLAIPIGDTGEARYES